MPPVDPLVDLLAEVLYDSAADELDESAIAQCRMRAGEVRRLLAPQLRAEGAREAAAHLLNAREGDIPAQVASAVLEFAAQALALGYRADGAPRGIA